MRLNRKYLAPEPVARVVADPAVVQEAATLRAENTALRARIAVLEKETLAKLPVTAEAKPATPTAYTFDIVRDFEGYLKTVIATPRGA